ncbi:mitochondrial cardiolipin hydrolase-like [Hyposmocoma kahamanoa]|uniref:mitochondrial cardiolipin hydrolase-like n=1 Tax=Hyposmocoma kahamanoa TaxID=1477025 RepID=UPI000E6D9F7D|nr:mitochondrial cardiolipin hydrolase-like [Hyposmocoma kahamanoa]
MSVKSYAKLLLISASFAIFTHWAYEVLTRKKKKDKPIEVHEVIMFSSDSTVLKKSKYSRCVITESMERLLFHLNSPRYSLDICMYVLTNMDMANAILKLNYKGVKVRIIIDADMAFSAGSNVRKLEKQGIPVRWMKSTNLMHHKFCILDASVDGDKVTEVTPLVIMGSLNWTNQALNGNWEDVTVTSQEKLVRQFKAEFERLWVLFRPIVNMS